MIKDVRQDIYDAVFEVCLKYGNVTDVLPPPDTAYPFIVVGEYSGEDVANKTHIFGSYSQMIHFFWLSSDRAGLTDTMLAVKRDIRNISKTAGGFGITSKIGERVLVEMAENKKLLHGVLIVTIDFN